MLSKVRVMQLFFMLVILLFLFFWRTFDWQQNKAILEAKKTSAQVSLSRCHFKETCALMTKQGEFLLNIKNVAIKAEQWIDFELTVPHRHVKIKKAQIVGKTMFMGSIPVIFSQSSEKMFTSKALLGDNMIKETIWALEITVNNDEKQQLLTFDFMVNR